MGIMIIMVKAYIRLYTAEDIIKLQSVASECEYNLKLRGDTDYNPKSLLNMFTVPLNKTLVLFAKTNNKNDFKERFEQFFK